MKNSMLKAKNQLLTSTTIALTTIIMLFNQLQLYIFVIYLYSNCVLFGEIVDV